MKSFQYKIEDNIKKLESLANIYKDKFWFVVESEHHVNVGKGHGLNGTAFAVKSPVSLCNAVVFRTKEDALKNGVDYYLIDGEGKPIYMNVTPASEFFAREVTNYKKVLIFIKEHHA
jgi:hypothetical protein